MQKIAVLGAGNIGEALIAGLLNSGVDPKQIVATNRTEEASASIAQRYGVLTETDNRAAVDLSLIHISEPTRPAA